MARSDYSRSEEWTRAEETMQRVLGFRINILPGAVERKGTPAEFKHPDGYQVQHFDLDNKPKAVRPASKESWDLWCELVRYRIEHDGACKMAWDLYAAATGVTVESFNGMPPGTPVDHVRDVREDMIKNVRATERERDRARAQLNAAGLCYGCASPSRETHNMVCQVCGTDYSAKEDDSAAGPA